MEALARLPCHAVPCELDIRVTRPHRPGRGWGGVEGVGRHAGVAPQPARQVMAGLLPRVQSMRPETPPEGPQSLLGCVCARCPPALLSRRQQGGPTERELGEGVHRCNPTTHDQACQEGQEGGTIWGQHLGQARCAAPGRAVGPAAKGQSSSEAASDLRLPKPYDKADQKQKVRQKQERHAARVPGLGGCAPGAHAMLRSNAPGQGTKGMRAPIMTSKCCPLGSRPHQATPPDLCTWCRASRHEGRTLRRPPPTQTHPSWT